MTVRAEAVTQALYIQRQCVFVDLHVNIWALWPRQSKGIGCDKAPNKGTVVPIFGAFVGKAPVVPLFGAFAW